MSLIPDTDKVLVLYGDTPLTRPPTLRRLLDSLRVADLALLTAEPDDPCNYGRIVRDSDGKLLAIVEQKDADAQQRTITEIHTGIIAANARALTTLLSQLNCNNAQGEYYLTDIVAIAERTGLQMTSQQIVDFSEVNGVNDRAQLAAAERCYQRACAAGLMASGVTLADPARIDIRGELTIGIDSLIGHQLRVSRRQQSRPWGHYWPQLHFVQRVHWRPCDHSGQ